MIRIVTQTLKIASILVVAVMMVVGSVAFFDFWSERTDAEDSGQAVRIAISAEDDTGTVAEKLADRDLIRWSWYFEGSMRISGDDLNPGTYVLRKGMSVNEIIDVITVAGTEDEETEDETASEGTTEALTLTFIEGQRVEEFAIAAEEAGLSGGSEAFLEAAANPANRADWDFLADVPEDASLEGFLFPDTYRLPEGDTADDLIFQMLANFDVRFTPEMRQQAVNQDLTIFEVVTLASLVEREAAVAAERPIVAAVYLNRIEQGMSLDADPILQYNVGDQGDGEWWPVLDTELLEEGKSSGFDTYS
ncbi:MAG: endolytic transglycosylase MltG, partial [Thermomicrobiales bacterium]